MQPDPCLSPRSRCAMLVEAVWSICHTFNSLDPLLAVTPTFLLHFMKFGLLQPFNFLIACFRDDWESVNKIPNWSGPPFNHEWHTEVGCFSSLAQFSSLFCFFLLPKLATSFFFYNSFSVIQLSWAPPRSPCHAMAECILEVLQLLIVLFPALPCWFNLLANGSPQRDSLNWSFSDAIQFRFEGGISVTSILSFLVAPPSIAPFYPLVCGHFSTLACL